jgi:hypothetical protein
MSRWDHPCIVDDAGFGELWSRDRTDPVLLVMGIGFDPRSCEVLQRLIASAASRRVDLLLLELPIDSTDVAVRSLVDDNRSKAERLTTDAGGRVHVQALPDFTDAGSIGRLISRAFQDSSHLDEYCELVIEVSAMSRTVCFPLVRGVLARAHLDGDQAGHWPGDLHVTVCESPEIDALILEEGTMPMAPIGGFGGSQMRQRPDTLIWVPVIGERAAARIARLYQELGPNETCPVLPWPSRDPRRSDRLVLEHRILLFQTIRLEPRNMIHAAERNPFDLYRTIGELNARYTQALAPLGSVGMVLSSHSSKLLSVGVLLAAYDYDLEVQHVSPGSYGLHASAAHLVSQAEIFDLWLTGTPYREAGL